MKRKKVWRFYCEFCKKASCSGGHISKHEKHCTKNPNRICRMCKIIDDGPQPKLSTLLVILPDPEPFKKEEEWDFTSYIGLDKAVSRIYDKLIEAANGCPACTMAAIRQKGIPVPLVKEFNFKSECARVWANFNEAQRKYEGY